ncbi:MAG: tetratricopeptide repeat protein, partial [Nitrospira sp.]|nr:tetratricopeptide repeat protein [Nitrospira sp.]
MRGLMGNRFVPVMVFVLASSAAYSVLPLQSWSASVVSPANRKDEARSHIERGETLLRQGDLKGAADAARRAVESNPSSAEGYYLLARLHLKDRKLEKAAEAFSRSLNIRP